MITALPCAKFLRRNMELPNTLLGSLNSKKMVSFVGILPQTVEKHDLMYNRVARQIDRRRETLTA